MRSLSIVLFTTSLLASASALAGPGFKVVSTDMHEGQTLNVAQVLKGFGCDGGNRSPELEWSGAPAGTKGYAVTLYDPDAPSGSGWWHWVVYNLPASIHKLDAGAGQPDFGACDFGGACPPAGDKPHRYIVTVHALDTDHLDVPVEALPALISFMLNAGRLGTATLTASYGRQGATMRPS